MRRPPPIALSAVAKILVGMCRLPLKCPFGSGFRPLSKGRSVVAYLTLFLMGHCRTPFQQWPSVMVLNFKAIFTKFRSISPLKSCSCSIYGLLNLICITYFDVDFLVQIKPMIKRTQYKFPTRIFKNGCQGGELWVD